MIEQIIETLPYLGVVMILVASGFGLPIPEDVPLLLGGYLCGVGQADIQLMVPVAFFAVVGADLIVFGLGRRYGHHVPRLPILRRYSQRGAPRPGRAVLPRTRRQNLVHGPFHAPAYVPRSTLVPGFLRIPTWKMGCCRRFSPPPSVFRSG